MKVLNYLKRHCIVIVCLVCITGYALRSSFFYLNSSYSIKPENRDLLVNLGTTSIGSLDVPVASVVLFKDSVLGIGYNTVNRDSDITGHAEINALNDVIRRIGIQPFKRIKDSIILLTTYEPCQMCKGVLLEYDIKNLVFLKGKGLWHWVKNDWKDFKYELRKTQAKEGGNLQDSLFRLHPTFK